MSNIYINYTNKSVIIWSKKHQIDASLSGLISRVSNYKSELLGLTWVSFDDTLSLIINQDIVNHNIINIDNIKNWFVSNESAYLENMFD